MQALVSQRTRVEMEMTMEKDLLVAVEEMGVKKEEG